MTEADAGAPLDGILAGTRQRVFAAWCAECEGMVVRERIDDAEGAYLLCSTP